MSPICSLVAVVDIFEFSYFNIAVRLYCESLDSVGSDGVILLYTYRWRPPKSIFEGSSLHVLLACKTSMY